ncbi:hypothetical protein GQX73_g6400 [Xylaria multiplex]|uniref:Heterokaryon incompatibility domain-containing protein n=1 Tax=Xylaria multiplex TaxID=323545 RepID=A0A7C8MSY4_9PEZI|nr:hypothetical protein GQX73_g6400 [Xylaria multiplex]
MHSKAQCPICEKVSLVITGRYEPPPDAESKELTVGTFAEIRRSQDCTVCQFVIEKLTENPVNDAYEDACPVAIWRWVPPEDYLYSFGPIESEADCLACGLVHNVLTLADLELADLNPDWIDLDRVRGWARFCDTEHGGVCHSLTGWTRIPPPSLAPLLLVDVISKCLVEIPIDRVPNIRYIALSYVWGQLQDILETTRANEQNLRQKRALASPSNATRLPDTVRDAIELVYRLNIPYLWADRLCIVQDDVDKKLPQLEQMGAIYANAYLTLVAADGHDANHGLRGSCPGVTRPRVLGSPLLTFSPAEKTLAVEPEFAPNITSEEWYRRGWTFQERTLSNRNLIFQQGRVFWECRGAVWTEELAYGPPSQPASSDGGRVIEESTDVLHQRIPRNQKEKSSYYSITLSRWPNLLQYEILVMTYNRLLLSFPGDGLRAFTGIINILSRSFPGGILYGMPEYFFDHAITWAPWTPIHRRVIDGGLGSALPSWSWAGWAGGVDWQKVDVDTGTNQPINNGYYEAAKMRKDKSMLLPDGWSRISVIQDGSIEEGFVHDDLPDDFFLWPLQIPDHSIDRPAVSFQPYLNFRASRAFLFVGVRLQRAGEQKVWSVAAKAVVSRVSMFNLHSSNGDWAGVLISNGAEESFGTNYKACDCVVVSGGTTWKDRNDEETDFEEWAQVDVIKSLPRYEFYNVICIEWELGIAYRKAVGRVWKEAWEQLDTSDIEVTLG